MTLGLRRIIALLGCAFALQLTAACTVVPAVASTPAAKEKPAGPAMWQVSDHDTTIYLFGTIHFLPRDVEWFEGDIERALLSSGEIVTEIPSDADARMTELMAQTAFLPEGENLRDMLEPERRLAFESLLVSLGIQVDQFDRYKPWSAGLYLSVLMTQLAGFDPEEGVELAIESRAAPGTLHTALETVDFQIELFNSLPHDLQIAYLDQVVASAPTLKQDLAAMLDDWLRGDAAALAVLINAEEADPALYRRLLVDRNAEWARWIKLRLKTPGTVFVAVGAGHLAGKGSVQDKLRSIGVRTKRVH